MKWDFKILPPMHTDEHGCLGLMSISRTRVGFFLLSFPKSLIGNLKYEEVRVYHEGHEEHEGLGLINIVMVWFDTQARMLLLTNQALLFLGLMVIIL